MPSWSISRTGALSASRSSGSPDSATRPLSSVSRWELIGPGFGIRWPEIDEDLSVAGLLGLPD